MKEDKDVKKSREREAEAGRETGIRFGTKEHPAEKGGDEKEGRDRLNEKKSSFE